MIETEVAKDGKTVVVKIRGRFDFSVHREFRASYKDHVSPNVEFRVDLSAAEYMDSSALGMLLLVKEHAESRQGRVLLERPSPAIREILTIANFDQLFKIIN